MHYRRLISCVSLSTAISVASQGAEPVYVVTDLGTLGGPSSVAYGINEHGDVVGSADISFSRCQAFIWYDHVLSPLAFPLGYRDGVAFGINSNGQICGSVELTVDFRIRKAIAWHADGTPELLYAYSGGRTAEATAINSAGIIVGYAQTPSDLYRAVVWTMGTMEDLGAILGDTYTAKAYAINDSGDIVGWRGDGPWPTTIYEGFAIYDDTVLILSSAAQYPNDINSTRTIVGDNGLYGDAYRIDEGHLEPLAQLPDDWGAKARGVNNDGIAVGSSLGAMFGDRAVIWGNNDPNGLNELTAFSSHWFLQVAYDINDYGQIAGYGINGDDETHAFLLTPIMTLRGFAELTYCLEGPGQPVSDECLVFDYDNDDDVDVADVAAYGQCYGQQ